MAQTEWKQAYGKVLKIEALYPRGHRQLIVTFSYEIQGQLYEGELYTFKTMHEGDPLNVTYDASNPKVTEFVVKCRRTWRVWWLVMATIFVVVFVVLLWIRAARR